MNYRYSGKTQKQMVEFVRENFVKRQTFQRLVFTLMTINKAIKPLVYRNKIDVKFLIFNFVVRYIKHQD